MSDQKDHRIVSAVFITFSGNCKKALTFYQTCFGGTLLLETFEQKLQGFTENPVINGSLVSDRIVIYGSDLVHNEGRRLGNYISIFLLCKNNEERKTLLNQLKGSKELLPVKDDDTQKLIEVTDRFDVSWILAV